MTRHQGEDERARGLDRQAAAETAAVITGSMTGRRAPAPAVVAALLAGACGAVVAARLVRARLSRGVSVPVLGRRCQSTHERIRHHER
ncbi:hypothetical protein AB0K18_45080 [Nonomuraea sp. NPDC049421]|uniref:hypothetical protein n=1 Tax=Nonomuraea sp. NPDC049421 TaxID=3155275 RepID=UPI00344901E8